MTHKLLLSREKRRLITFWLVIFVMIASRQLEVLGETYLMAEDASCFLTRALEKGLYAIFMPNTGYIQIIPQFVTWFSLVLSKVLGQGIKLVPYFMMLIALMIETAFMHKICSKDFRWLVEKDFYRLGMAIAAVLLTSDKASEVWHNITCWQWWSGFYIMLIGVKLFHDEDLSVNKMELAVLVLIGLSTPLVIGIVCVFSGVILMKIVKQKYNKKSIIHDVKKFVCVFIPCIIQGIFTLLDGRTDTGISMINHIFSALKSTIASVPASVLYPNYLNQLHFESLTDNNAMYVAIALGMIVWMIILAVYIKYKKMSLFIYELFFIFGVVLLEYVSNGEYIDEAIFWNSYAGRYLFIPQMCFAFLITYAVFLMVENQMIFVGSACATYLMIVCMLHFQIIGQAEFSNIYSENSWLYSENGFDTCSVQVNPPMLMWGRFNMPVDFSEFEEVNRSDGIKSAEVNFVFTDDWQNQLTVQVLEENEYINIKGWCVDYRNESNPSNVVIELNGKYFAALLQESFYVDEYMQGNGKYLNSGFTVWIPGNVLHEGSNECNIYGFNKDNRYYEKTESTIEVKK